jgi:hypothetical protein
VSQGSHCLNGRLAWNSDKGSIRHGGQFRKGGKGFPSGNFGSFWIYRPYFARKPNPFALADDLGSLSPAHNDQ